MLNLARLLRPSCIRSNARLLPICPRCPRRTVSTALHPVHSAGEGAVGKTARAAGGVKPTFELDTVPEFIVHRIQIFEKAQAEYALFVKGQMRREIVVTMPDGATRAGTSWETRPMDVARAVSQSLSERAIVAKVDGQLWDLERPLEGSCNLELLDFDTAEGKRVFWHSSAHVLGAAAEQHFGSLLCTGPATADGFFYDMGMTRSIVTADLPVLEAICKAAVKARHRFERLVLPKATLLEMFKYNKYKKHLIEAKVPDGTSATVYRCGTLVDLCRGPHLPRTSRIKAFSVLKNSASHFLGDPANDALQRVYGISFPDQNQLTEYKASLAEAAKRDHRKIGKDQELFFFHETSPGSAFFLPHGTRIYNALTEMLRSEYRKHDYQEVISPTIFNSKLWETSGHWQNYHADMFTLAVEHDTFALKPMNCPGHCLVFGARDRSYRELPLRLAEFGVLHRNEAAGALSGLTRVRRFVQDDVHVFCTPQQIEGEIAALFEFLQHVYGIFGFEFELELSTRPKKFLGDAATWDVAEKQLAAALDKFHAGRWTLNAGDGAFYGPKIDIKIRDALRRAFQCGTIQLDFQLPAQFGLSYQTAGNAVERPVMIHRAVVGSIERFIAISAEHFAGKWPFWLSPRQVLVIPVAAPHKDYAKEVGARLSARGLWADVDDGANTLQKKIRHGEVAQYNFILVVGQDEVDARAVNVRNRDDVDMKARAGAMVPLDDVERQLVALKESRGLRNVLV